MNIRFSQQIVDIVIQMDKDSYSVASLIYLVSKVISIFGDLIEQLGFHETQFWKKETNSKQISQNLNTHVFLKISRTEVHSGSFSNCLTIYREALLYMTQLRTK